MADPKEQRRLEFIEIFKKCEPEALAPAFAAMLAYGMVTRDLQERVISEVREHTRIIRHNKRVQTRNNKHNRLMKLMDKKRQTKEDHQEIIKLAKDLGYGRKAKTAPQGPGIERLDK